MLDLKVKNEKAMVILKGVLINYWMIMQEREFELTPVTLSPGISFWSPLQNLSQPSPSDNPQIFDF